jgi:hypothetical protein
VGDVINLRRERKRAARGAGATEAAENRTRFGQTKQQRQAAERDAAGRNAKLDGHLIDKGGKRGGEP